MMEEDSIWFCWEDHRRSRELANAFRSKYFSMHSSLPRIFRYFVLSYRTMLVVRRDKPSLVFCQNPSIILALVLCLYKKKYNYKLIVDRHSNFKFEHKNSNNPIWILFWFISKFTVRRADLTIVTNESLKVVVNSWGGEGFVLPDKIPDLGVPREGAEKLKYTVQVLAITTFDSDEPIREMLECAKILGDKFTIKFTGRYHKYFNKMQNSFSVPENVRLLGFVSEDEYRKLLHDSDVVIVLTKKDLILNCGAYEAVAMNIPAVVSNTKTMKDFFFKGFVHVDLDPLSIAEGVRFCFDNRAKLKGELSTLRSELECAWDERYLSINKKIAQIAKNN